MSTNLSTSSNIMDIAASLSSGNAAATSGDTASLYGSEELDESVFVAESGSTDDVDNLVTAEGSDTAEDSESGSAEATAKTPTSDGTELLTVTDDKGKRQIKVDWNDKERLKKYVQMAHGARKWQKERDSAISAQKELQEKYSSLANNWESIEQAYQSSGIAGLVNLLEGAPDAFEKWEAARLERHSFLQKASPAQRELFEAKERESAKEAELARIRKENEDFRNSVLAEKEAASLASLESTVHPAFDRYRFADKLGDVDTEAMFDELLWNNTLKRLEPYEEQGVPLTASLVEKEFKAVSTSLRKRINTQAEKKAAKVVENKKREATENAQVAVSSGYTSSALGKEAMALAKDGNISALLKNWSKYGKAFGR